MADNTPGRGRLPYPADNQDLWNELKARPTIGLPVKMAAGTKVLVEGPCTLQGFAVRETAAAAGTIDFYDGRDVTGEPVASGVIAASGAFTLNINSEGILFEVGLTIVVGASTIQGGCWVSI